MENIYKPLMKSLKALLFCVFIIMFFGCSDDDEVMNPSESSPSTPTTLYIVNGKVVSEEDKGIPSIQVEIIFEKPQSFIDTLYTGSEGKFEWEYPVSTFGDDITFTIAATDTNGVYEKKVTPISFKKDDSQKDITWFLGEAKKNIVILLKEKKD